MLYLDDLCSVRTAQQMHKIDNLDLLEVPYRFQIHTLSHLVSVYNKAIRNQLSTRLVQQHWSLTPANTLVISSTLMPANGSVAASAAPDTAANPRDVPHHDDEELRVFKQREDGRNEREIDIEKFTFDGKFASSKLGTKSFPCEVEATASGRGSSKAISVWNCRENLRDR